MSVPKYDELMKPLLLAVQDGGIYSAIRNDGTSSRSMLHDMILRHRFRHLQSPSPSGTVHRERIYNAARGYLAGQLLHVLPGQGFCGH